VAERAGVSEGVLFHRFKSKEGLFSAAMDFDRDEAPRRVLKAIEELEGLEVREGIIRLATTLVEVGRVALPIMMMSWSNPQPCAVPLFDKKRSKFREILKTLGGYFEQQMQHGKLRQMDAEVLRSCERLRFISFLGMGVQEPDSSWGTLVSEAAVVMEIAPWAIIGTGGILAVTLLCLNFIGDGLRDALDPKDR